MLQIQTLQGFSSWITQPQRYATHADVDFGSDWFRTGADRNDYYQRWRVGWLSATRELYAVRLVGDEYVVIGALDLTEAKERIAARQVPGDLEYHNLDKLIACDPAPEPQEVLEYHQDECGGFYTTSLFWECSCDGLYYIHARTQDSCPYCSDCREGAPDARVSEVLRQSCGLDEQMIKRLEESLEAIGLDIYTGETWVALLNEKVVCP